MSWNELVRDVALRAGVSQVQARRVLDAFVDIAAERVVAELPFSIRRLGTLTAHRSAERTVRNISTGRKMLVGGALHVRFRAAASLKRELAERTDNSWRDPSHQAAWRLAETLIGDLALYAGDQTALPEIAPDADLGLVEEVCAATFGADWSRAVATYEAKVSEDVRSNHHYLGLVARRRWARASA